MNEDLKIIKKMYGEKMMHLCRELFHALLEKEGLLSKVMLDNFAPSRFLYDDIIEEKQITEFKNYIYSLVDVEKKEVIKTNKTPKELLEEAGYVLYECKTEKDIQSFKRYYSKGEELCTFNGGRLNRCHVFFAVKKNVDEIKRENFKKSERQDEYGTSVISIQFSKGAVNTLSIKNRYNHTVNNPDATFSNNLENIIEGLTESFEKTYNLNINQNDNKNFELLKYVKANDGKYYKCNYEINNIYYCPNNIIIDNFEVKKYDKERYIVLDYFILDLQNKTIELYDTRIGDSFIDEIKDIDKISISKENISDKTIEILIKDGSRIVIELDETNQIVRYKNDQLKNIGDRFLVYNDRLKTLEIENVIEIGDDFLLDNKKMLCINLPYVEKVGNRFLYFNVMVSEINMPNLKKVGESFLCRNNNLTHLSLKELREVGHAFLNCNMGLSSLDLPKLISAGDYFLYSNEKLRQADLPNLTQVGKCFLYDNEWLFKLNVPKLKKIGFCFLRINRVIKKLNVSNIDELSKENLRKFKISDHISIRQEIFGVAIKSVDKSVLIANEIKNRINSFIDKKRKRL